MSNCLKKCARYILIIFTILIIQSCKTDEFKFNEMKIKDGFGIRIITPLYSGKDKDGKILEFRDFIHDWNNWNSNALQGNSGPFTVLQYSKNTFQTIPTNYIFDPSVVIDNLEFLIQGGYNLTNIELDFVVANSCPFPLNLQLQFLGRSGPNNNVPSIIPPAFPGANFTKSSVSPVKTIHNFKLDSAQSQSFIEAKSIKLTSWYDSNEFIIKNDTLWAHYPIDVSIVLTGTVHVKQ